MSDVKTPCRACGKVVRVPAGVENKPIFVYHSCPSCNKWGQKLDKVAKISMSPFFLAYLAVLSLLTYFCLSLKHTFLTLGLLLDIFGVLLLIGRFDALLIAGTIWNGGLFLQDEMPKHTKRVHRGIIYVTIGFSLQIVAQLV